MNEPETENRDPFEPDGEYLPGDLEPCDLETDEEARLQMLYTLACIEHERLEHNRRVAEAQRAGNGWQWREARK